MFDIDTNEWRSSNKADITAFTTVADAVPQVAIQWQPSSANDKPVPVRPMHETDARFPVTSKHIRQMTAIDPLTREGSSRCAG